MKTPANPSRQPAFTLVELLVVITIIAVLAALGFAGFTAVIQRAKRAQALEACGALVRGIESYYDEYGALPDGFPADLTTDSGDGVKLVQLLTGGMRGQSPDAQNPKGTCFFQAREASGKKGGIEWSGDTVKGLWDPWGGPYQIRLDVDHDQRIDDPLAGGSVVRGPRALVYTHGKNQRPDGGTRDDVKSW